MICGLIVFYLAISLICFWYLIREMVLRTLNVENPCIKRRPTNVRPFNRMDVSVEKDNTSGIYLYCLIVAPIFILMNAKSLKDIIVQSPDGMFLHHTMMPVPNQSKLDLSSQ